VEPLVARPLCLLPAANVSKEDAQGVDVNARALRAPHKTLDAQGGRDKCNGKELAVSSQEPTQLLGRQIASYWGQPREGLLTARPEQLLGLGQGSSGHHCSSVLILHIAPQSLMITRLFLLVGFGREGLRDLLPFAVEPRLRSISSSSGFCCSQSAWLVSS
jgi:hypothetical protein